MLVSTNSYDVRDLNRKSKKTVTGSESAVPRPVHNHGKSRSERVDMITGYPERMCGRNGFHQRGASRFCRIPLIYKIVNPVIPSTCSS